MNKLFTFVIATALVACASSKNTVAQTPAYTQVADSADKVLKGYINRQVLESDTAFKWFADNMKYGTANDSAVQTFAKHADRFTMLVFGGTWCHDTQNLLPIFYRLVDKSGYPQNSITLVAVDRKKKALDTLPQQYNITNVPTFIVLKEGKEVGRVVEYGKEGFIDKELGEIVRKAF